MTVRARRIGNSSFLPSKDPRMQGCQSFALVAIGHFATDPLYQHKLFSTPDPLPTDICGRRAPEEDAAEEDGLFQILIIIIVAVASCLLISLLAYCLYFLRRRRRAERAKALEQGTETQYLTSVAFDRSLSVRLSLSVCLPPGPTPSPPAPLSSAIFSNRSYRMKQVATP